jgi:hypothetical protein
MGAIGKSWVPAFACYRFIGLRRLPALGGESRDLFRYGDRRNGLQLQEPPPNTHVDVARHLHGQRSHLANKGLHKSPGKENDKPAEGLKECVSNTG